MNTDVQTLTPPSQLALIDSEKRKKSPVVSGRAAATTRSALFSKSQARERVLTGTRALSEIVDATKIEAIYAKGLLTVKLPKLPQPKAKAIPLKTA